MFFASKSLRILAITVFCVLVMFVFTVDSTEAAKGVKRLEDLSCAAGEVALYDGADWVCSDALADASAALAAAQAAIAQLQIDLAAAESAVAALQGDVVTAQADIEGLQTDVAAVQANTALDLDGFVSLIGNTIRFSGVNVQVVDGSSVEGPNVTGLGNLIVGYDSDFTNEACSVGPHWLENDCTGAGETWAANQKNGHHNLVVGDGHNYTQEGGVVFGLRNTINRESAVVTGGWNNTSAGIRSNVAGGNSNFVGLRWSSISGGFDNRIPHTTTNGASVISGGSYNVQQAGESTIGGGSGCVITDPPGDVGWGAITEDGTKLGDCQ